jgi:predicted ATPase
MIRKLSVNGFRSLNDFHLELNPGLNILIGPNGSGKTNIILFFEFLSQILQSGLGDAVSRCGGAGSLFQKVRSQDFIDSVSATIEGDTIRSYRNKRVKIFYEYSFMIKLSEDRDYVFYESQNVKFSQGSIDKKFGKWDFVINKLTDQDMKVSIDIERIDFRKFKDYTRRQFLHGRRSKIVESERHKKIKMLEHELSYLLDPDINIFFDLLRYELVFRRVTEDMIGGDAFNIVPSVVKEPEDAATQMGVRKDGAGLSATLYTLKKHSQAGEVQHRRLMRSGRYTYFAFRPYADITFGPTSFDRIVEFSKIVNEQILDIDVEKDQFDNKLKIFVNHLYKENYVRLPISLISDGTIKWIALITAILTYRSIFAIEEPENFIHPLMQHEILRIMRETTTARHTDSFVLMTTHSETLLNSADVSEVVLVQMRHGVTRASRVRNRKLLEEEINRTGFGLGHYYLAGALEDG